MDYLENIGNTSIDFNIQLLGSLVLKAEVQNTIILRNQARIIAKLEGEDEEGLCKSFDDDVKRELAEIFKDNNGNKE